MKSGRFAVVILLLLSALLSACEVSGDQPDPTAVAQLPVAPTSTATAVPGPPPWSYLEPAATNGPQLLAPGSATGGTASKRIKPDWEVNAIEYLDQWWGLGTPGLDDQLVTRAGGEYILNGKPVPAADVQALVAALDNLYPAQMLMSHSAWTDDYPSWSVELTGADGQHILLEASSTGNPGYGPWSVLYNGRLYAQYDGAVAKAIGKIFGGRLASDKQQFDTGADKGDVAFSTGGLPAQLIYGFWGLLPIANGFSYWADAGKGEIGGEIQGSSRIGSMEIGEISKLNGIELTVGGKPLACQSELLPAGDPWTARIAWKFTCPVADHTLGSSYRYPIQAHFATGDDKKIDVAGELVGAWRSAAAENYVLLPAPPEIAAAFAASPLAQDVLSDHVLGMTLYAANLNAANPLGGTRNGEAILFGASELDGKQVRYSVAAQFAIEDGKLTYWSLGRSSLSHAVGQALAQPLTRQVLAADPHAVVNVWYADGIPPTPQRATQGFSDMPAQDYAVKVNSCGAVPGGAFPSTAPLVAFGYNMSPFFYRPPFVIIDGRVVVFDLDLYPAREDAGAAQRALVPTSLDTGSSRPFERIYMQTTPYSSGGPTLTLTEPQDATAAEQAIFDARLNALPLRAEKKDANLVLYGVTLAVGDDGTLSVVSCAAPQTATPISAVGADAPRLAYSTFYGSSDAQEDASTSADALAVDAAGNAYIAGMTSSHRLPLKDAADSTFAGDLWDGFMAKLDPDGASLLLGTYFGSGDETTAEDIAVDSAGNIYLTGSARTGFRVQNSPIQPAISGDADAYVIKISAAGKIVYATLLGGSAYDTGISIAADKDGNAYVTGDTDSADFHTAQPLKGKYGGQGKDGRSGDVFVAKISPDGGKLLYSTYLGGSAADGSTAIAVDDKGVAYLTGYTLSDDFPLQNPLQAKNNGGGDAFVTAISADGSSFVYSTFLGGGSGGTQLGGRAAEYGAAIAVDASGNAYVAGRTGAADFPLLNALYPQFNHGVTFSQDADHIADAFVAELNPSGSALVFSTFLGGSGADSAGGVGVDAAGNVYVGGSTTSADFPLWRFIQGDYSDKSIGIAPDSFITKLRPSGASLAYSTYFGAEGFDALSSLAVDSTGNVYIAGSVESDVKGFPLAGKPFQSTNSGIRSAFIAKISDDAP